MLSLSFSAQLGKNEEFEERVLLGFNVVAHQILIEDVTVANHILRVNHANMILQLPENRIKAFVSSVIASPNIQNSNATQPSDINDEQILEGINSIWNSLIGISPFTEDLRPAGAVDNSGIINPRIQGG